jgi:16S rRNA (uracil1498-N3)-methyltransferase
MTTHRFHVPDMEDSAETCLLSLDQSRQVSRVLRMRTGDQIVVFSGDGAERIATLSGKVEQRVRLELGERHYPEREPALRLTVGLAILRNERFDMAIQKLTELGVARIAPIRAERCVISYDGPEAWAKRAARLQRIVVEAAEQSERTKLPDLHPPQTVSAFLERSDSPKICALMERGATTHISRFRCAGENLAVLVGPEGGWSAAESALIAAQAAPVNIGSLILRSETAAIAAASYLIFSSTSPGSTSHV